jgi:hypothetical protein
VALDEHRERLRFLERGEILALEILDQRDLEVVVALADQRGDAIEPGDLGRPEPTNASQ